jgi:hypothetical protein
LYHTSYYGSGILSLATKCKPSTHPYLAFRISQTNIRNSLVFNLTLTAEDKKTYVIALNAKPPKGALNAEQKIEWKSDVPNRLIFNVKELLSKSGVAQEDLDKIMITSLIFERGGTQHGDPLTMDDFYILAPPENSAADDPLTWVAYDASGVGGLVATAINPENPKEKLWSHEFASTAPADLKTLREKMGDAAVQWIQFQAKDKAGNLSLPFEFPLVK